MMARSRRQGSQRPNRNGINLLVTLGRATGGGHQHKRDKSGSLNLRINFSASIIHFSSLIFLLKPMHDAVRNMTSGTIP